MLIKDGGSEWQAAERAGKTVNILKNLELECNHQPCYSIYFQTLKRVCKGRNFQIIDIAAAE